MSGVLYRRCLGFRKVSDALHEVRGGLEGFQRHFRQFQRIFDGFQKCYAGVLGGLETWGPKRFQEMSEIFLEVSEVSHFRVFQRRYAGVSGDFGELQVRYIGSGGFGGYRRCPRRI